MVKGEAWLASDGTPNAGHPIGFPANSNQASDSSVWVRYTELGHYSQVSLIYQNVYQCTLQPGVVKAYVTTLLIYNLVTLLSRFIKIIPFRKSVFNVCLNISLGIGFLKRNVLYNWCLKHTN